ncbi:hypothetical protein [Parahaliea aestuarii]|uniref:Uncharacterized protein n=1 Tax=Parahaliea aestuarii TaxID=1852021 RepID=A0A5C8ZMF1_9GAMM|nr:hypothetical protein [Parahaliea aestuarii]TXS89365.1 hypothetical protein FVW59_17770 [Parahaliea aestuarii]
MNLGKCELRQAAIVIATALAMTACSDGSSRSGGTSGPEASAFCEASDVPVVNPFDPSTLPPLAITKEKKATLQSIRNAIFGGSQINAALQQTTISGKEPPVFALNVDDRALLVWTIGEGDAGAFALEIDLPAGLALARASLPATPAPDASRYYLLADIGNASRASEGARIEWKTFVSENGDPTPRLYRFDKAAAAAGLDLLEARIETGSDLQVTQTASSLEVSLNGPAIGLAIAVPLDSASASGEVFLSEAFLNAGERTLGPGGLRSAYYYDGSSVSSPFTAINPETVRVSGNVPWLAYTEELAQVLVASGTTEYMVQPLNEAVATVTDAQCQAGADAAGSGSELFTCLSGQVLAGQSPDSVYAQLYRAGANLGLSVPALATLHYAVADLYHGLAVFAGAEKPRLFFSLKPEPKAIFINYEIPEERVADFKQAFLPESFELARIRFYPEQCEAVYAVSLNVYEASGQNLDSFRAEWSTYVINPAEEDPRPRFSVLEAQSTAGGFDPVIALERYTDWQDQNPGEDFNFLDPSSLFLLIEEPNPDFSYRIDDQRIRILLEDMEEGIALDVDIALPADDDMLTTRPLPGWMEANDFVYWEEVADLLKYDRNVMFAELKVFEAQPSDTFLDSTFEGYVNPEPLPIILWNGPQFIALEPWGYLDEIPVANP